MPSAHQYRQPPHIALPLMPGRWGVKAGYVYAIICARRTVKIGSSVHPGLRIGEQCRWGAIWDGNHYDNEKRVRVRSILLSGAHLRCREFEVKLHRILQPFRLGHHRNEKYRLTTQAMESLIQLFQAPLSERRLQRFTEEIYPQQEAA